MTYKAIIAPVKVRQHPNADKLQLADVAGSTIVVGLDTTDGELGVFFPTDGKLSPEYCSANDLYPIKDPETGERIGGGYFTLGKERVRSQRFRGEKSEGYWAPVSSLAYTGYDVSKLHAGYEFDELNGHKVCEKYYTPATLRAMKGGTLRRQNEWFPQHVDTEQLKWNLNKVVPGSLVTITLKMHGTSARISHVLDEVKVPRKWWQKLLRRPEQTRTEWAHLVGTRRTILRDPNDTVGGFYGDEAFRWKAVEDVLPHLRKGEIVYGELVGFLPDGRPIMGSQSTKEMKELKKQYGPTMTYSYGCVEGQCKFIVYRIAVITEDKHVVDYSWSQVKARAAELGLETVPEFGTTKPFPSPNTGSEVDDDRILNDILRPHLLKECEDLAVGPDPTDPRHIREGVVVRLDQPSGKTEFYKLKSFDFGVLEGYLKQSDDYVDTEEIA